jgi:hypothetical protein
MAVRRADAVVWGDLTLLTLRGVLGASIDATSARSAEKGRELMRARRHALSIAVVIAAMALLGVAGAAHAAFPDFTGCTATNFEQAGCLDIQNRVGTNIEIKGFNVPLGESLEIRGTLRGDGTFTPLFVPPAGTNGFFARAVPVPGGLLGIECIPGNTVLAITELAGSASEIRLNILTHDITIPVKVRLVNLLLGMDCHIGTTSRPVVLNLTPGTTSPPPPNRPITGSRGTESGFGRGPMYTGAVNVDNSFAVPGATECGLGLGLINSLVNLRLRLPSAAGNNAAIVHSDVAIRTVP